MNTQAQHTPGPWTAHRAFHFGHDSFMICGTNGDSSPFLCRLTDDTPNYETNARLIAAAPELLELAEQIVLAADQNEGQIPLDIAEGARLVLAKAKGEA